MKVSIDGILSTAIDLKNKKAVKEEANQKEGSKVKTDSVHIKNRLTSRLGAIQTELKELQSSLTKNQVIKNGINEVIEGFINDDKNINSLVDKVKFENSNILSDYLGNDLNYDKLINANDQIVKSIERDVANLKELQVEIENISASTIIDSNIEKKMSEIELSLSEIDDSAISKLFDLSPDMVLELIR